MEFFCLCCQIWLSEVHLGVVYCVDWQYQSEVSKFCCCFTLHQVHMSWLGGHPYLYSEHIVEFSSLMAKLFDLDSGSMEFVVPAADPSAFFPIDINFSSNKTFCDLKVCWVIHLVPAGLREIRLSHPLYLRCSHCEFCFEKWKPLMDITLGKVDSLFSYPTI
jgi:hypothetical protein